MKITSGHMRYLKKSIVKSALTASVAAGFSLTGVITSLAYADAHSPLSRIAIKSIQGAVADQLNDPDSAKFRAIVANGSTVCGYVNAKNQFGGYVGFKPFIGVLDQEGSRAKEPVFALVGIGGGDLSEDIVLTQCHDKNLL